MVNHQEQKIQLISTLDPIDIKDVNLDSRVADRGLEQILIHAGMTDENRESDDRQNEALFEELMRDPVSSTTTATVATTTTTTTTTNRNHMIDDIMKF